MNDTDHECYDEKVGEEKILWAGYSEKVSRRGLLNKDLKSWWKKGGNFLVTNAIDKKDRQG